ncbi:MAG: Arylsulfatase [candidate division BRC1 bacterium ADurb.BinA364]|nr:MAG: Arylsulfatase [candidate division BRC1 bacterium ADurb.BinA364]
MPGDAALLIDPGRATMPSLLRQAGYATAAVGKWHLGLGAERGAQDWNGELRPGPLEIGFEYCFIMPSTGDRVPCVYVENRRVANLDPADPLEVSYGKPFEGEPTGVTHRHLLKQDWRSGHNDSIVNGISRIGFMKGGRSAHWIDEEMADTLAGKAVEFIERSKDKPFFLYFATHDIHVPRVPAPRFAGVSPMGPRGDAIVQFDFQVGAVLEALDRLGLAQNTLVIVTSDNGPVINDGYQDQSEERLGAHRAAGPHRAGKYSIFEGGTRIPFVARWPGRIRAGSVSAAAFSQVDLAATFAALAGAELAAEDCPDSLDARAALLGEDARGRSHIIEHSPQGLSIRAGDWKYILPGTYSDGLPIRIRTEIAEPGALYNVSRDPGETENLAAAHPDAARELRAELERIREAGRTRGE